MEIILEMIRSFVVPIPIDGPLSIMYIIGNLIMQIYALVVSGGEFVLGGGGLF